MKKVEFETDFRAIMDDIETVTVEPLPQDQWGNGDPEFLEGLPDVIPFPYGDDDSAAQVQYTAGLAKDLMARTMIEMKGLGLDIGRGALVSILRSVVSYKGKVLIYRLNGKTDEEIKGAEPVPTHVVCEVEGGLPHTLSLQAGGLNETAIPMVALYHTLDTTGEKPTVASCVMETYAREPMPKEDFKAFAGSYKHGDLAKDEDSYICLASMFIDFKNAKSGTITAKMDKDGEPTQVLITLDKEATSYRKAIELIRNQGDELLSIITKE